MKSCTFCSNEFIPKSKNQKYCCQDCCRKATNKKIMQKYYENKERLRGKIRHCEKCSLKLSMYNPKTICYKCEGMKSKINNKKIKEAMDYVIKQAK